MSLLWLVGILLQYHISEKATLSMIFKKQDMSFAVKRTKIINTSKSLIRLIAWITGIFVLLYGAGIPMDNFLRVNSDTDSQDNTIHSEHAKSTAGSIFQETGDQAVKVVVTATMYRPTRTETDDSPDILADGTRILVAEASRYRFLAMSRNLLKRWDGPFNYGDYVVVDGAGKHSGIWQVKDTMNPRWQNRIDFLQSPGTKIFKYENVVVRKGT